MNDLVGLGLYKLVTGHPPPPIDELLDKLSSEHSRRTYRNAILRYLAWIERDPFEAAPLTIANYKGELLAYNRPATVALRLRIIRELYQEAVERDLVESNPAAGVSPPSFTQDPSCTPPSAEVAAARLATCDRKVEAGRRDYALCLLAIETSIQPAEVPTLQVAGLQRSEAQATLEVRRGLSRSPVRLTLSEHLAESLDQYLAGREVADDSPLFGLPRLRGRAVSSGTATVHRQAGCEKHPGVWPVVTRSAKPPFSSLPLPRRRGKGIASTAQRASGPPRAARSPWQPATSQ